MACVFLSRTFPLMTPFLEKKSEINVVINTWILLVLIAEEQVIMHRWLSDPSIQKSGDNSKIKKS